MKYPEHEATQIAQDIFFWFDHEHQEVPGKEYIQTLENASPFADKLKAWTVHSGYTGDHIDWKATRQYIIQRLQQQGIIKDDKTEKAWMNNLRNWLVPQKGQPAPKMPGKRESVYQLCFALGLNADEAGEFFVKGYLEWPYGFKNLRETIYYYCLNNSLPYAEAERLYQVINAIPFQAAPDASADTASIGRAISDIHDEQTLIEYMQQNRWVFEHQSQSSRKKIKQLVELCKPYAAKERNTFNFADRLEAVIKRDKAVQNYKGKNIDKEFPIPPVSEVTIDNTEALLNTIYGHNIREDWSDLNHKQDEKPITLKDTYFPKLIRDRMLYSPMQIFDIEHNSKPDSVARSALILFNFYFFFMNAKEQHRENNMDLFDEFVDETDGILLECGYGQLYWKNPYDWMIGYCTRATDPIEELRSLICEFFVKEETEEETVTAKT